MRMIVAAAAVAALTGCGVGMPEPMTPGTPLTPEQSRAQVIDAATEIVSTLRLAVLRAVFWHASCTDQGGPPYRGQVRISYPRAESYAESESQIATMIALMAGSGWSPDPGFHSHNTAVTKDHVTAVFSTQNASVKTRAIEVISECRTATTARLSHGSPEWITLP